MVRNGYDQCPKCGTWRKKGLELESHIQVCTGFRCPWCGHPAHDGHRCHANGGTVYKAQSGYTIYFPKEVS